jgi:hypothetical protein
VKSTVGIDKKMQNKKGNKKSRKKREEKQFHYKDEIDNGP